MATFRTRSGKIQVRVQRQGFETQSATFSSLADAQKWARRIEAGLDAGLALGVRQSDKVTLAALIERYAATSARHKGASQESYRLKAWADSPLAARDASLVRSSDIAEWRDEKLLTLAPATVLRDLAVLSSIYELARLEWGLSRLTNPCRGIKRPAPGEGRTRRMDAVEVEAILAATGSEVLRGVLPLALETTCRRGELIKLCWRDVSLKNRTATIRDAKNGLSRTIALSPSALTILEKLPRRLDGGRLFEVDPGCATQAFVRAVHRARAAYEVACAASGQVADPEHLVGLRFHDSRREGTSQLFEAGFSIPEVANQTGHLTWSCLRRYTNIKATDLALKLGRAAA